MIVTKVEPIVAPAQLLGLAVERQHELENGRCCRRDPNDGKGSRAVDRRQAVTGQNLTIRLHGLKPLFTCCATDSTGTARDESYCQSLLCKLVFNPPQREESVGSTSTAPV